MRARTVAATLVAASLLLLAACTQGEGPVVERSRDVGTFSKIEAGGGVQVSVAIGEAASAVIRAQENIQERVSTEVRSDGTLRIEAVDDFVVADPVVVELTVPQLEAVTLSGGASVDVTGLDTDAFELTLSGGARATLAGTAGSVVLAARGGSQAFLDQLDSQSVTVTLDGGANAEITAAESVRGSASGGATLRVRGNASVNVETSGGAEVSHT